MPKHKTITRQKDLDYILPRLHHIWANIPATTGMQARKEIKQLIDELENK